MRFRHAVLAVSGVLLAAVGIVVSGAEIAPPEPTFQADPVDVSDADLAQVTAEATGSGEEALAPKLDAAEPEVSATTGDTETDPASEPAEDVAQPAESKPPLQEQAWPPQQGEELERVPPRPPLRGTTSEQPATETSNERKSTRLFKPVAPSAGTLEAQGYRIALAGIEPILPEEKCDFDGSEWPCGLQARTAFRSWLRGRAIACTVPPQPDQQEVVAECNVGKTDISEWLVSNGWAKPTPAGPYVDAGRKASEARKGIYGRAPAQNGIDLPRVADPEPMVFPETDPAIEEPTGAPLPAQPPLTGPFPPAPSGLQ